ncbi:MAG: mechanosensitive ion channel [Chloroflexota bacterium]|nr:mechanosensitive ion channel [Chloroflexota bacterium]
MTTIATTFQELLANFLLFLPDLIAALVIFVVGLYLAGLTTKVIKKMLKRRDFDPELTLLITQVSRWTIIVLILVISLEQVGFDLSAFLAGLGILGFTVGFALQDVSKNFFSGLFLLLEQPFDIGDTIEVGGYRGTVANVELRATELYTLDGQNVIIPNADVFTKPIKNFSRFSKRRIELNAGVAYGSDLEMVRQTALDAIAAINGVMADPAPKVVFNNLGGSTIDFTLYYWVNLDKADYWGVVDAGIVEINNIFEAKNIEMPFPTQEIRLVQ